MRAVRITGSGFVKTGSITDGHPVEFRHWQEIVDEADSTLEAAAHSEEEEGVVELWLEDPSSFQNAFNAEDNAPVTRTTGSMIRSADNFGRKQAVAREASWERELADAQAHAKMILTKLGNGR